MSPETFTTLVSKAQDFNEQEVGYIWQGGEPMLMGLEFFEKVVAIQEQYSKPGQTISNVIQTNGVLIDEKWGWLFAQHHFLVGVSIDGPPELHDIHRFTRTEKSVYERVMNACDVLKECNVDFNVLAVINNDTVKYPVEVYTYFLDQDFHYLQFIPCLEVIDNGIAPFSVDVDSYGRFLCILFDEWFKNGYPYVSIRLFDNLLQHCVGHVPECCMYQDTCGGYLVVEHNGDVFPCDFFVMGEWLLGNIREDSVEEILKKPKYKKFSLLKRNPHEECENCEWLSFCQRGCVKFRYLPQENYDALHYLCDAYKMFFEYTKDRYRFLAWDIIRRQNGGPAPLIVGRNDPCFCGSRKKYKKCCEPYSFVLKK